jgi:hypothetical protein
MANGYALSLKALENTSHPIEKQVSQTTTLSIQNTYVYLHQVDQI